MRVEGKKEEGPHSSVVAKGKATLSKRKKRTYEPERKAAKMTKRIQTIISDVQQREPNNGDKIRMTQYFIDNCEKIDTLMTCGKLKSETKKALLTMLVDLQCLKMKHHLILNGVAPDLNVLKNGRGTYVRVRSLVHPVVLKHAVEPFMKKLDKPRRKDDEWKSIIASVNMVDFKLFFEKDAEHAWKLMTTISAVVCPKLKEKKMAWLKNSGRCKVKNLIKPGAAHFDFTQEQLDRFHLSCQNGVSTELCPQFFVLQVERHITENGEVRGSIGHFESNNRKVRDGVPSI